jgi:hypothetical protein
VDPLSFWRDCSKKAIRENDVPQLQSRIFIEGLRQATRGEFQITTDGFSPIARRSPNTLEDRGDFAMLLNVYTFGACASCWRPHDRTSLLAELPRALPRAQPQWLGVFIGTIKPAMDDYQRNVLETIFQQLDTLERNCWKTE